MDRIDELEKTIEELSERLLMTEAALEMFSIALEKAIKSGTELGNTIKEIWLSIGEDMRMEYEQSLTEFDSFEEF